MLESEGAINRLLAGQGRAMRADESRAVLAMLRSIGLGAC